MPAVVAVVAAADNADVAINAAVVVVDVDVDVGVTYAAPVAASEDDGPVARTRQPLHPDEWLSHSGDCGNADADAVAANEPQPAVVVVVVAVAVNADSPPPDVLELEELIVTPTGDEQPAPIN